MKKVISACIDRLFEFDSGKEAAAYLDKLRARKAVFVVVAMNQDKGKFFVRTKVQYNNNQLLTE